MGWLGTVIWLANCTSPLAPPFFRMAARVPQRASVALPFTCFPCSGGARFSLLNQMCFSFAQAISLFFRPISPLDLSLSMSSWGLKKSSMNLSTLKVALPPLLLDFPLPPLGFQARLRGGRGSGGGAPGGERGGPQAEGAMAWALGL